MEGKDVIEQIKDHLKAERRNLTWLSEVSGIKYYTIYSIFKQRIVKLSDERLNAINEALGTNFTK